MKKNRFYWAMLFCSFLLINLIACGGGGGGEGTIAPAANDSASSTIGSTGGILATPSGNISLNIPANALNSSIPISIAQSTEGDPPGGLIGSYEFKPDGLTFNTSVTISIKYDPALISEGINEADLKLAYASGGEWIIISNSTVDTVNHIVSGQTTHFTNFSIKPPILDYDSLIGNLNSVEVRSNGESLTSTYVNTVGGVITGYKWQCVEFVNRYYLQIYGKNIILSGPEGTNDGNKYYQTATTRGLASYPNDAPEPPQVGDILVSEGGVYGHVAIVKEVSSDKVYVTQQNWFKNSRDLNFPLSRNGNHVGPFGGPSYPIKGWLRLPAASLTPPSTPTGYAVTAASSSQIDLSWNASTGATGYKVYKSGAYLKTVTTTSTSDTGLNASTNYCYYVIAYNSAGDSVQTSQLCATTQAPPLSPPSTPTGFTVNTASSSQIYLAWVASTGTVTGYKIYRSGTYLKSVTATSTSDTGLSASTNYCYYITAYNSAGESTQTSQICATTQAATSLSLNGQWSLTGIYTYDCAPLGTSVATITITQQDASHFTFPAALNSGTSPANGVGTISGNNITFSVEPIGYPQDTGPVFTGTVNTSFTYMSGTFRNGTGNTWCSFGGNWTASKL